MASPSELLADGFGRVRQEVLAVLEGLSREQLRYRIDEEANPIGWLVWHLTRVQDDHVADVADTEQSWTAGGWVDRFTLPFDRDATGYGQESAAVGRLDAEASLLAAYHTTVHDATSGFLRRLSDGDLDQVVDTRWDPPVTLGVRLISVLADDLQHVGQAAYVRGVVLRR